MIPSRGVLRLLPLALSLGACVAISEDSVIPTDGDTMLQIYRSASADEPVGQDATLRAMNRVCQQDGTPETVKRCIELLKKSQNTATGSEPANEPAYESAVASGAGALGEAGGVSEPGSVAPVAAVPVIAEHTKTLRHPEPLNPDYIRSSSNEVRVLFPRLPNPDIEIFVFPHLATSNNVPVPGYSTVMPLYDSVQYAMPGEARSIDGME